MTSYGGPLNLKYEEFDFQTYKDLESRIFKIKSFHKDLQNKYYPKNKNSIILGNGLNLPYINNESSYNLHGCVIQMLNNEPDGIYIKGYFCFFSDNDGLHYSFKIPWGYLAMTDEEMRKIYLQDMVEKTKDDEIRNINLELFLKSNQVKSLEIDIVALKEKKKEFERTQFVNALMSNSADQDDLIPYIYGYINDLLLELDYTEIGIILDYISKDISKYSVTILLALLTITSTCNNVVKNRKQFFKAVQIALLQMGVQDIDEILEGLG